MYDPDVLKTYLYPALAGTAWNDVASFHLIFSYVLHYLINIYVNFEQSCLYFLVAVTYFPLLLFQLLDSNINRRSMDLLKQKMSVLKTLNF